MPELQKTNHGKLTPGQDVFKAMAYSSDNVLELDVDQVSFAGFLNNPVLLEEHDPERPVGNIIELGWKRKSLMAHLAFDVKSSEGKEAQRKWQAGLKSSLSIGLRGSRKKGTKKWQWRLLEISQVSIPLDPRATATTDQRSPYKVASIKELASIEEKERENFNEILVYFTASGTSTTDHRDPIGVYETDENTKAMTDEQFEKLLGAIKDLSASTTQAVKDSINELKTSEPEDKLASAEGTTPEDKQDAAMSDQLASIEAEHRALDSRKAALDFKDLLPQDFDAKNKDVMEVLKAAAPSGLDTSKMSEETLRYVLNEDLKTKAKVKTANTKNAFNGNKVNLTLTEIKNL